MNSRLLAGMAAAMIVSILLLGVAATYSAWVSSSNHHASCTRVGLLADEFENVIALALTPAKGKTYTPAQVAAVALFESRSSALLDQARC